MNDSEATTRAPTWRLILARVLVVIGVLLAVVTIIAGYLRWQLFDNSTFEQTSTELIANDAIRDQVAITAVDQLYSNVDVSEELQARLPEDVKPLAGPLTAGLRQLTERIAIGLLERPRVQELWVDATGAAHAQLVDVLRNETTVVTVKNKAVVLDLRPLLVELGDRLSVLRNVSDRLPENAGVVKITDAEQLDRVQKATSVFEAVATWIWIVPFLLWALALWLARGRRRLELRAIAIGLVLAGLLVLAVRSITGGYILNQVTDSETVRQAAEPAYSIITQLLADGAWACITLGLVALVGVWLSGPTRSGTAARRWLAPVFGRPELTYGILALLLLLFVWWEPYPQARRILYLLVFTILLVVGVELLRRAAVREFPDEADRSPREMVRMPGFLQRESHAAQAPGSQVDELERLTALHEKGAITDEELALGKARVLGA